MLRNFLCKKKKKTVLITSISTLMTAFQERGSVLRPPSNSEVLRNIQRNMSMLLDTRFHIWLIMTLYFKMRQILLQNATAILLQNATEVYYKMRQVFYYKMRQLLQNSTVITKFDVYYKSQQYMVFDCDFNIHVWDYYVLIIPGVLLSRIFCSNLYAFFI